MRLGDFLSPDVDEGGTQRGGCPRQPKNTTPYHVRATKNGGIPVAVVKRKHHKVVVVSNIDGDSKALLTDLQRTLGTGGVIRDGAVEIQGEQHLERVRSFLVSQHFTTHCLVGVSRKNLQPTAAETSLETQNGKKPEAPKQKTTSIDTIAPLSSKTINGMKPPQLKEHLAALGLSSQGNRKELVARLLAATTTQSS
jgi:translation initiation factor 1 (eIF-1/SUI1)